MRTFGGKQLRAVILTFTFSVTFVPVAVAAPVRDRDVPTLRDEVVRIVRVVRDIAKKKLGTVTSFADSLTIPRP